MTLILNEYGIQREQARREQTSFTKRQSATSRRWVIICCIICSVIQSSILYIVTRFSSFAAKLCIVAFSEDKTVSNEPILCFFSNQKLIFGSHRRFYQITELKDLSPVEAIERGHRALLQIM